MFEHNGLVANFDGMYLVYTPKWRLRFLKDNKGRLPLRLNWWNEILMTRKGICIWSTSTKQWVPPTVNSEVNKLITEAYLTWITEKTIL